MKTIAMRLLSLRIGHRWSNCHLPHEVWVRLAWDSGRDLGWTIHGGVSVLNLKLLLLRLSKYTHPFLLYCSMEGRSSRRVDDSITDRWLNGLKTTTRIISFKQHAHTTTMRRAAEPPVALRAQGAQCSSSLAQTTSTHTQR